MLDINEIQKAVRILCAEEKIQADGKKPEDGQEKHLEILQ